MKRIFLAGLLATCCATALAGRTLPHIEHVKRSLSSGTFASKAAACKGQYLAPEEDGDIECWAAHTARDLKLLPGDTQALVLADVAERDSTLARCLGLSMSARMNDRQCTAHGQADTFIALRLPRMKLPPVKFKLGPGSQSK